MADNLFEQAKFVLGVATFAYSIWAIWGTRYGIGSPPWFPEGLSPNLGFLRGQEPVPEAIPPDADVAPAESNLAGAWYYGRPIRDAGLPWETTQFGENDPKNRLTIA